ncbi:MAG: chemotaxis-specific protein-glutamate methyltransferase CheB [Magnetospirillum sp. WYHS-4]
MKKIRVLIVEDSPVVRELLLYIIGSDARFEVVAAVGSAEEALQGLDRFAPDVISLDIRLPGMNGLDATLEIMATHPMPIVVVSASVQDDELNIAMNALRAGALTVVEKPVGVTSDAYRALADQLCNQLAIMSQVRVVKQARRRNLNFGSAERMEAMPAPSWETVRPKMLGLVASTGGPNALSRVLNGLPRDFPLPILIVQHMTAGFVDGFVQWLSQVTPFPAHMAGDGMLPRPASLYLPPADHHLEIKGGRLYLNTAPPVVAQRPSGTVLFKSMARDLKEAGIGVLLTGMGADGAEGMLEMRRSGAYTLAEDESTTVIYGMPGEAVRMGAVRESLPLDAIALRLRQLVGVLS